MTVTTSIFRTAGSTQYKTNRTHAARGINGGDYENDHRNRRAAGVWARLGALRRHRQKRLPSGYQGWNLPLPLSMRAAILLIAACALSVGATAKFQRSGAEVQAFKRHNPCPSTEMRRGPCPGYQVDHVQPLCSGGPDKEANMQWLAALDGPVHRAAGDLRAARHPRPGRAFWKTPGSRR